MNRIGLLTAFALSLAWPYTASALIYDQAECDSANARVEKYEKDLVALESASAGISEGAKAAQKKSLDEALLRARMRVTSACESNKNALSRAEKRCREMPKGPDGIELHRWNARTQECDSLAEQKAQMSEGDCNQAELYAGSSLKGQNCKIARNTITEVQERNKALNEITVTGATSVAQIQAMSASGDQQDSQKRANKMLMGLSLARLATGLSQGAAAVQLKNAAGEAEDSSARMSSAYKQIDSACANPAGNLSREECFYANAGKYGVAADKGSYARYLSGGATQAEEAAKAASSAATGSTITGLADTLVGLQALQMARQADKNANNMTSLPPPRVIGIAPIRGASQAPNLGGFNTGTAPIDYGNPGDSGTTLGNVGAGDIRGGLKDGRSFGGAPFVSAKSTVTSGGGSGGSGGRGGGGQSKAPSRGRSLGNTGVGEYAMGGGAGQGFRGGAAKAEKDGGGNAFTDALAKLFPQDENGKPIVDGRQLASEQEDVFLGEEGSTVYASDLTIFEQITAKYRQLSSAGSI